MKRFFLKSSFFSIFVLFIAFTVFSNGFDSSWVDENNSLISYISNSQSGINSSIIQAMKNVPRHIFLEPAYRTLAYKDISLPGMQKELLPSPSDCIRAIEMLSPSASDRVLIVGNNCGYTAAVLSNLAGNIYLIEETDSTMSYQTIFSDLGIDNITVSESSDINSFNDIIAFDKILIHGAVSGISEKITERLSIQGNITFILSDSGGFQQLVTMRRTLLGDSIICGGNCYFPEITSIKISN